MVGDHQFTDRNRKTRGGNDMELRQVKMQLGRIVYYDTGQMNIDGNSVKDFIFSACILRKDKKKGLYYQAELKDTTYKNSVIIVPLEKVLIKEKVRGGVND